MFFLLLFLRSTFLFVNAQFSPPASTAVAISLAATPAHLGKLFADLTTEVRRAMDGVMSAVENTATEEDRDEDETAVAANVSIRAATATQARRTEEDRSDRAFDDGNRLAIAGGGLAKAAILRVFFSFGSFSAARSDFEFDTKKEKGTRLCPPRIARLFSPRERWKTCTGISSSSSSSSSEDAARRPRGRRCRSTSSRCRIRRPPRQTRASPLRCPRRRRFSRSPPAFSRPRQR